MRAVPLTLAALAAIFAGLFLSGYRAHQAKAAATPAATALVKALQDVTGYEEARRAREAWADHERRAGRHPTITPRVVEEATQLVQQRRTVLARWARLVVVSIVWALACVPGFVFFTRRSLMLIALLVAATGGVWWLDGIEGARVLAHLTDAAAPPPGAWRLGKLSLLTATAAAHVIVVGGALRAWVDQFRTALPGAAPGTHGPTDAPFTTLMWHEWRGILRTRLALDPPPAPVTERPDRPGDLDTTHVAHTDEPFVTFRAADLTGVALSGGGIRSATFNLGLLQGLHDIALLARVDYLATVSGGGYLGAFWSAWLVRTSFATQPSAAALPRIFPSLQGRAPRSGHVETDQERHLREFGRFLAPRVGLLEVETWTALVAALAGLLPALVIALSMIGLGLVAWLALTIPLAAATPLAATVVQVLLTTAVLVLFEYLWQKVKLPLQDTTARRASARRRELGTHVAFALLGVALVAGLHWGGLSSARSWWRAPAVEPRVASPAPALAPILGCLPLQPSAAPLRYVHPCWERIGTGEGAWWRLTGLATHAPSAWLFSPSLFDYAWVWLAAALGLVAARLAHPLLPLGDDALWVAPLDRVIMRLLGLAVFWTAVAALWHVALNLDSLVVTAVGAGVTAGAFALLRNWIGIALQKPKRPDAPSRLQAVLPQVLAYLTVLLTLATVGQLLVRVGGDGWSAWWASASVMTAALVVGLFIDPAEFGLHAFYRTRISRAYTGASNLAAGEGAPANRLTDPRPGDDPWLHELACRPLHLVCCAANDLNGDDIGTLGRGARSAVLSRYGLAVGPHAAQVHAPVSLGAAVTASAAAFNSNMGDVSTKLGPAVSFVMTALNLRLGLWLRHPAARAAGPRRWPGLLLYREYFGLTSASGQLGTDGCPPLHLRDLHLSDGGHFENLALYELVRRHCRYILVSDCGADPTVAFDDLGRALRRIRQDFGIDISLDVEALRPDPDGRSRQHVAVGRIHYSPTDVGILLYVKPTLTGDEPADVLQYKTRNGAFPHEGTGDQFYDEAQWESYRRLGLHVAETVFAFVPPAADPASGAIVEGPAATPAAVDNAPRPPATARRKVTADWVFGEAAGRWGPTPPGLEERVLEMTGRVAALELDLQHSGAQALLHEVFPELSVGGDVQGPPAAPLSVEDQGAIELIAILRVTQVMEDVWMACGLDTWWSHPLNMGWVNFFARWVTAPTFRFWWPLVGPMYSKGFRDFLDDRYPMPDARARTGQDLGVPWEGRVRRIATPGQPTGLAAAWWSERSAQPCPWRAAHDDAPAVAAAMPPLTFENLLTLRRPGRPDVDVQVGLVATWPLPGLDGPAVMWTSDDFFVPPSLWGASIGWYFLDNLLNALAETHRWAYVIVRGPRGTTDHRVAVEDTRNFVDQYRKIGFRQRLDPSTDALPDDTRATLEARGYDARSDTLFVADLPRWKATRGRR